MFIVQCACMNIKYTQSRSTYSSDLYLIIDSLPMHTDLRPQNRIFVQFTYVSFCIVDPYHFDMGPDPDPRIRINLHDPCTFESVAIL